MLYNCYSRFLTEKDKNLFTDNEPDIKYIFTYFPELLDLDICIYHSQRDRKPRRELSEFIPLKHPKYHLWLKRIEYLSEYLIIFTKKFLFQEKIKQYAIAAHEFQHAAQYFKSKKEYIYSCILRDYGKNGNGICKLKLPTEIDADQKAKIIITEIFGPEKVDGLIRKYSISSDIKDRLFGDYYKSLDLDRDYYFEDEVISMWKTFQMEAEIARIRLSPSKFQRDILQSYEFANR